MEKDLKIILFFIAGIGTVLGAYYLYTNLHKFKSKPEAVLYLVKRKPDMDAALLMEFDDGFVISWADGLFADENTFSFENKKYSTASGKSI